MRNLQDTSDLADSLALVFLYCERGPSLPWVDLHTYVDHYIPFKVKYLRRIHLSLDVYSNRLYQLNKHMTIDKWIARFQLGESQGPSPCVRFSILTYGSPCDLGLSKIVPTETFEAYQVRRVPNIYSNSLPIGRFRMRKIVEAILCINGAFELPYTPSEHFIGRAFSKFRLTLCLSCYSRRCWRSHALLEAGARTRAGRRRHQLPVPSQRL